MGRQRIVTVVVAAWRHVGWRLTAVVVATVVGALGAAPFLPAWGAAAAAAAGAVVVGFLTHAVEQRAAAAGGSGRIEVVAVGEVLDALRYGVHPAQSGAGGGPVGRVPPFVARDALDDLVGRLTVDDFVLVVGESTAGKSRLAFEAVRIVLTDYVLVRPRPGLDMQQVGAVADRYRRCVVWLDELDQYLGSGGLTTEVLAGLLRPSRRGRVVIVATMRVREYDRYSARHRDTASAESWRAGRDVLLRAGLPLELDRRWSVAELARARSLADDPRIAAGLRQADRFGLAEVLAAGPELVDGWRRAWEPGFHPRGAALVAAAVDCRRMGLHRPVPVDVVVALHYEYLEARGGAMLRPESVEDGLEWATSVVYASSSLLLPYEDGLLAFDYLIDQKLPVVPDRSWSILLEYVTPREAYDIGWAAIDLLRSDHALPALDIARRHGVPNAEQSYIVAVGNAGQVDEAAGQLAVIARRCEREFGADHALTIRALRDYTRYLGEGGDARSAVQILTDLWPREVRRVGSRHESALTTRRLLGRFQCENGEFAAGLSHLCATVEGSEAALGPYHVDTLQSRLDLARYTVKGGDPGSACTMLTPLVNEIQARLGTDHPLSLSSRFELARAIGEAGGPVEAHKLLSELEVHQRRVFGDQHPRVLSTRHYRARFAGEAGELVDAVAELRDVLAVRERISGLRHARTLSTRLQLSVFVGRLGDPATAAHELTQVLADCQTRLGDTHPRTLRAAEELRYWTYQVKGEDQV